MIIVFAGTSDAREYVYELADNGEKLIICTTTAYGASLYKEHSNILEIIGKPLDKTKMIALIKEKRPRKVINATHPYAVNAAKNISQACDYLNVKLERMEREALFDNVDDDLENVQFFKDYDTCAKALNETEGNILLTIGSRRLEYFCQKIDLSRLIVRVLPTSDVLKKCEQLGLTPKQIIAMQGPFTKAMNEAIYEKYNIQYMVTKDSGKIGGTEEKVYSAIENGINVCIIRRTT